MEKITYKNTLLTSIKVFITFSVVLGLLYPLVITGIAQLTMKNKADGSLILKDGKVVGSTLIAQKFEGDDYFHSRPSAVDYNAGLSGASNYGPTNKKLQTEVKDRIAEVRKYEGIATNVNIPSDMVTASGSGLDPHISIENAKLQSKRVAKKRKLAQNELDKIIEENIDRDFIGIWGQDSVNVIKVNMALDKITGK